MPLQRLSLRRSWRFAARSPRARRRRRAAVLGRGGSRRCARRHARLDSSPTSFPQSEKAVSELAAEAPPQAAAILDALGDNRLLIDPADHLVAYKTTAGAILNAKTGAPVEGVDAGRVQEGPRQQRAQKRHPGRDGIADPRQSRRREAPQGGAGRVQDARRQGAAGASGAARQGKRSARRRRLEARASLDLRHQRQRLDRGPSLGDRDAEGARRPGRAEPHRRARPEGHRSRGEERRRIGAQRDPHAVWPCGAWRRTSGTAFRLRRSCCSPPSGSPSPSASWASSTWRMARW